MPGEGEIGFFFDEIRNLVEPIERPHMEVRTGLHSLRMAWCCPNSPADEEHAAGAEQGSAGVGDGAAAVIELRTSRSLRKA
jgi:hypothetical protein